MNYLEITDKSTHVLKSGAGFFQGYVVNAAGSSWTIQIFDDVTASSPKGTIAGGSAAVAMQAAGSTLAYDVHFSNGLTIVTAGTTAGSITVAWY